MTEPRTRADLKMCGAPVVIDSGNESSPDQQTTITTGVIQAPGQDPVGFVRTEDSRVQGTTTITNTDSVGMNGGSTVVHERSVDGRSEPSQSSSNSQKAESVRQAIRDRCNLPRP